MRINQKITGHSGFTLAEMMVVMLILSVVMAAFAPIMTRRNKADLSNASPWKMVTVGENHIYYVNSFDPASKAVAQIGAKMEQSDLTSNDINSRLLIATNSQAPNAISFGWRTNGTPAFTKLADMAVLRNSNNTNGRIFWGTPGGILNVGSSSSTIDNSLGDNSLAIGINSQAGFQASINSENNSTALGNSAKAGGNSTAVGYGATAGSTTASTVAQSVAIGYNARAGLSSISIGNSSAGNSDVSNNSNRDNIAIGVQSLYNNTGDSNTAIGNFALQSNTTGSNNVAIGYGTISSINNGNVNTGSNNVAIGYNTLLKNNSGSRNVAVGRTAQKENTTGSDNVAIGYQALQSNQDGSGNTAIGYKALTNATGGNTTITRVDYVVNVNTGVFVPVTVTLPVQAGQHNTAIGYNSLSSTTTGGTNIAVGKESGGTITTGSNNIALGLNALGGYWNGTAIESSNTTGSDNIAIGQYALSHGGAFNGNIAIGAGNLQHLTSGGSNVAIGHNAMSEKTSGSTNIAIGLSALGDNTTGSNNIAIGDAACAFVKQGGSNRICIGRYSGPGTTSNSTYETYLSNSLMSWETGNHSSTVYIGGTSLFNSGKAVLEIHNRDEIYNKGYQGANTTSFTYNQGWGGNGSVKKSNGDSCSSDRTCKGNIPGSTVVINGNLVVRGYIMTRFFQPAQGNGDEDIYGILGYGEDEHGDWFVTTFGDGNVSDWHAFWAGHATDAYYQNMSRVYTSLNSISSGSSYGASDRRLKNIQGANNDGLEKIKQLKVYNFTFKNDAKKLPHTGVIAQDLQKIFPNAVTKGEDGYLRIRWDEMFFSMVNSIKELAAKVTGLEDRLTKLEKENQELKARLTALENKLK